MQTDALHFDFSKEESKPERIRVRKRVRIKSKKRYKNNSRKQPLSDLRVKNWVTLGLIILLLIALVAGLFYLAYNHFPDNEVQQEYEPVSFAITSSLE